MCTAMSPDANVVSHALDSLAPPVLQRTSALPQPDNPNFAHVLIESITAIMTAANAGQRWLSRDAPCVGEVSALLDHWRRWHLLRAGFGLVGFYCALRAVSSPSASDVARPPIA